VRYIVFSNRTRCNCLFKQSSEHKATAPRSASVESNPDERDKCLTAHFLVKKQENEL